MSKFQDDIIRFNAMYGLPAPAVPTTEDIVVDIKTQLERFHRMLTDELSEIGNLLGMINDLEVTEEEFLAELADWLGDIQVYAASEMRKFGLPNDEVLDIIMQSNFSKLGADGKAIVVDGKVQKGPNYWKPEPKLLELVARWRAVPGPMPGGVQVVEASTPPKKSYAHGAQVGGSHYAQGDNPQHWDLSIMYQWDPFQYQITKYVMRWKDKHPTAEKKLEDLKKAKSFLDKYISEYRKFLPHVEETTQDQVIRHVKTVFEGEIEAKKYFTVEGYWGDGINLYKCRNCRTEVRGKSFLEAHQSHNCEVDSQAGPAYVSQG